jgi:hypothetical protein
MIHFLSPSTTFFAQSPTQLQPHPKKKKKKQKQKPNNQAYPKHFTPL